MESVDSALNLKFKGGPLGAKNNNKFIKTVVQLLNFQ